MPCNSRFIFFGTPEFAAVILEKLIKNGFVPAAVVCNPDRPVGRKKIVAPPPVKTKIMNYEARIREQIKIFQPENLPAIHDALFMLQPDFFIVAAYAKIIPKEMLKIPRLGAIGVHPSLLPKYRGPSPIQAALLGGEEKSGVTLFLMDEKADHGPILARRELNYEARIANYESLMRKLAELGADLLIEALPDIENKIKNARPQDESQATYTKKFKTEDGFVDFNDLKKALRGENGAAESVWRKIRALNPEPGVFTVAEKNGQEKRIKLLSAALENGRLKPTAVQPEGKKPLVDLAAIRQYINQYININA